MSGLVSRWWRSSAFHAKPASSRKRCDASDSPCALFIALRSAPAQNTPPAPVRMAQRMFGSLSMRSQASAIPTSISGDSAFFASGRFIVTTRTCPCCSVSRCAIALQPFDDRAGGERAACAHRDQRGRATGALELVQRGGDQAAARRSNRMAERDRAAVDVDAVLVDLVLAGPVDDDRCECLVDLE